MFFKIIQNLAHTEMLAHYNDGECQCNQYCDANVMYWRNTTAIHTTRPSHVLNKERFDQAVFKLHT